MMDVNRKKMAERMARSIVQDILAKDDYHLITVRYKEDMETFNETNKILEEKFNVKCYPIPEHENISVYIFNYVPEIERKKIIEKVLQDADKTEDYIREQEEFEKSIMNLIAKILEETFGVTFQ